MLASSLNSVARAWAGLAGRRGAAAPIGLLQACRATSTAPCKWLAAEEPQSVFAGSPAASSQAAALQDGGESC